MGAPPSLSLTEPECLTLYPVPTRPTDRPQEKGRLNLAIKQEQQRRCRAEAEQRRVQEQLAFRLGEVKHLKEALRGRDGRIQELQDRLRELELTEGGERTAAETVRQAEGTSCGSHCGAGRGHCLGAGLGVAAAKLSSGCVWCGFPDPGSSASSAPRPAAERDELRAAMHQLLARLDAANAVIGQADANMGGLEAQLAAAAAARQAAEQKAEDARAEAAQLREAVEDLQVGGGLGVRALLVV